MSVKKYSRSRDGSTQITPNFRVVEFASRCGADQVIIDARLPQILQRIRELHGNRPLSVNSGYRTAAHNTAIGGAANSFHVRGMAADITIGGLAPEDICRAAETALREAGIPGGICIYPTFTHVDVRPAPAWRGVNNGRTTVNRQAWAPWPTTAPPTASAPAPSPAPMGHTGGNDGQIWVFLKSKGLSDVAAAGMMGNLFAESAFRPTALERAHQQRLGHNDASYTAAINSGNYSRKQFRSDRAGYGIAQWTFGTRKERLYDHIKPSASRSIGSLHLQLEYLWAEMQTTEYRAWMTELSSAPTVRSASDSVLTSFMRPADMSTAVRERRAAYSQTQFEKFSGKVSGGDI